MTIETLKLRIEIFTFYDRKIQRDACKKLLEETMLEEKTLRESLSKESRMDIDSNFTNRITPLPKMFAPKIINVIVHTFKPIELSIRYHRMPRDASDVMNDISKKCWIEYGVEPVITHLVVQGQKINPTENVETILKQNKTSVEAFTEKIVQKTSFQLYQNAASRLEIGQLNAIKIRLSKQNPNKLALEYLNLASDQKNIMQPVLQHSTLLQTLDLSSNYLNDHDLSFLLKDAHKGLTELNLRNNLLTAKCLSSILLFPRLRILDLSFNTLGATVLQQLPSLLENLPSIREIKLSFTHLGDFTIIDEKTKEAYMSYGMSSNTNLSLILDLSNNHFHEDMLFNWTKLWINLNRISKLCLSNISSDTKWENFSLLSDLPNFSSKKTLRLCGFQQLVTLKPILNQLDLSCCDLKAEHIDIIAQSLKETTTRLGKLILHCNPRIGDSGVYYLNGAILQSKINVLDISDCGVTNDSKLEILQWTHYLKEIDLTENNLVLNDQEMESLNPSTYVRLSPKRVISTVLPNTPFD
ncbi:hypothetical protein BD770DRAFT_219613 [Pilaira anomala]|nr:hypothetical protein BD770DRAFT_219613 [Pilaira anomala]